MKKNNKGFTLVELIVVLVILAILAAILVPTLLGYIDRARSEKDFSTAQTVRVAAQAAIDQAYGEGKFADGSSAPTGKSISIDGVPANTVAMSGTIAGATADATSTVAAKKYVKMTYTLSGVDANKVTAYSFTYANGVITNGTVTINGHVYTLGTDGTWTAA
ncbi:MAG: type II secretion system protein [Lachnospiraceae bacterium]|nr:type II secretion system protein [Lachnospiraceae bacterium]